MIIKNIGKINDYDVKEAYGQDAEGVTIKWISESSSQTI